jgi:hypothetical protein
VAAQRAACYEASGFRDVGTEPTPRGSFELADLRSKSLGFKIVEFYQLRCGGGTWRLPARARAHAGGHSLRARLGWLTSSAAASRFSPFKTAALH